MTQCNPDGVVKLSGALGIDAAATVCSTLRSAMQEYDDVEVDLSSVEELELPCLQLLCSAYVEARKTGKKFSLSGALAPRVTKSLGAAGFALADGEPPETGERLDLALRALLGRGGENA